MRAFALALLVAMALARPLTAADLPASNGRWPAEKAWAWYRSNPWFCGFNYVPAGAISSTEMFMPDHFDVARMDRELALAQSQGFNCARVFLPFIVWEHDPAAFKERLSTLLQICQKHSIRVMPTLLDDCAFGPITDPVYGPQPEVVPGWFFNGWVPSPGPAIVRDRAQWPRLEKYVKDLLTTYENDGRIFLWDLYNEPRSGGGADSSVPLLAQVFAWAREVNPSQPCSVDTFGGEDLQTLSLEQSDILTFHNYEPPGSLQAEIDRLKRAGRPIICSEWLNRGAGSTVASSLPIFVSEDVGCLHWGLVNGRLQADLNWGHRPGQPLPAQWQHDLFRGDYTPYNSAELRLFRRYIRVAAALRQTPEKE